MVRFSWLSSQWQDGCKGSRHRILPGQHPVQERGAGGKGACPEALCNFTFRWPAGHVASAEHSSTLKTQEQGRGLPEASSLCCKHPVSPSPTAGTDSHAWAHIGSHSRVHTPTYSLSLSHTYPLPTPSLPSFLLLPLLFPLNPHRPRHMVPLTLLLLFPISQAPAAAWHLPPAQEPAQHRRQNDLSAQTGMVTVGRKGRGQGKKMTLAEKTMRKYRKV